MPDLTDAQLALLERILASGSVDVDDLTESELSTATYLRKNLHLLGGGLSSFFAVPETLAVVEASKERRKQQADEDSRRREEQRSDRAYAEARQKKQFRHDWFIAIFSAMFGAIFGAVMDYFFDIVVHCARLWRNCRLCGQNFQNC